MTEAEFAGELVIEFPAHDQQFQRVPGAHELMLFEHGGDGRLTALTMVTALTLHATVGQLVTATLTIARETGDPDNPLAGEDSEWVVIAVRERAA